MRKNSKKFKKIQKNSKKFKKFKKIQKNSKKFKKIQKKDKICYYSAFKKNFSQRSQKVFPARRCPERSVALSEVEVVSERSVVLSRAEGCLC